MAYDLTHLVMSVKLSFQPQRRMFRMYRDKYGYSHF